MQPPDSDASPVPAPGCHWVRRFLVCNPFYLASAALLLYGLAQTSQGAGAFQGDVPNLLFNFVALQLYSALLLAAAVALSRRGIWYDSALLVVLEHGLVLVPFMLVSLAALLGRSLGMILVVTAAVAAIARAAAVHRAYPRFNLPARALLLGLGLLLLNVAGPLLMQWVVDRTSVDDWAPPNRVIWNLVLPVAALGALCLPRSQPDRRLEPERSWIPWLVYGLWIAGSAVHAWSLGYVCKQAFSLALLAPTVCAGLWAATLRITAFLPRHALPAQRVLFALIGAAPLLASERPHRAFVLFALNHLVFLGMSRTGAKELRALAGDYALGSLAVALMFVPEALLRQIHPTLPREVWVLAIAGAGVLTFCWRGRNPLRGLTGALVVAPGAIVLTDGYDSSCLVPQAVFVWLLAHSHRWSPAPGAIDSRGLKGLILVVWVLHAAAGTRGVSLATGVLVASGASLVLALWAIEARRSGGSWAWWFPAASLAVGTSAPLHWILDHGPVGVLALVASFGALGLGTGVAWTRRCWDGPPHA